jgi:hypothetical protein
MRARNRNRVADARALDARTVVGVIVASLLLGGTASMLLQAPRAAAAQTPAAKPTATAPAPPAKVPAATTAKPAATPATPAANTAKPAATTAKPAVPAAKPAVKPAPANVKPNGIDKLASSAPGGAANTKKPAAASGGSAIVQSSAHLDEQVAYQYNALGRRDPFQSLLSGEYVGVDVGGDAPPDVGGLKVVGIVWGDADQFALVEDARGDSHILRRGDKVMNGYVEALKREAMVVNLTVDGQSQLVTVPLTRKGEKTNANR